MLNRRYRLINYVVKKKTAPSKKTTTSIIPQISLGGNDVIGQKPIIPKINNNYVYGAGLLIVLGAGFLFMNPMLLGRLLGRPPPPGASVMAPPMVQPGAAVPITGSFNPPVPQAWYVVTNQQGQQVASGSLGNNVSTFATQVPATNLPNGNYTVTVSDTPPTGAAGGGTPGSIAGGGAGSVYPTAATLQQGLVNNQLGPATSGPENISLS